MASQSKSSGQHPETSITSSSQFPSSGQDQDTPVTYNVNCLSALPHKPDRIRDHQQHYFGCIEISEREHFLDSTNAVWEYERGIERDRILKSGKGQIKPIDAQNLANDNIRTRIGNLAVTIESQYKRTDNLRRVLRKKEEEGERDDQEAGAGSPGPRPAESRTGNTHRLAFLGMTKKRCETGAQTASAQTSNSEKNKKDSICRFVSNVEKSHNDWAKDSEVRKGLEHVRAWRNDRRLAEKKPIYTHPITALDDDLTLIPKDRDRARKEIQKHRGEVAWRDQSDTTEYDVERDVNAYLIQYKRDVPRSISVQEPLPSRVGTGFSDTTSSTLGSARSPISITTSFPQGSSQESKNGETKTCLQKFEADHKDTRFKGQFPDQRVAISYLLEKPKHDGPKSILSSKNQEDDSLRYIHIPSNNMEWIEKVIARYYDEEDPKLHEISRVHERTHTNQILRPQYWHGQQRGTQSGVVHARQMRPLCERVSSSIDEIEQSPKNIVLFMPYMHWETDRKRETITRMIGEESEKQRRKLVDDLQREKNKRKKTRYGLTIPDNGLNIDHPDDTSDTDHPGNSGSHPSPTPKGTVLRYPFSSVIDVVMSYWSPIPKKSKAMAWQLAFDTDDNGRLLARSKLGQFLLDAARLYEAMHAFRDKQLLEKFQYSGAGAPLHPRRTLDQSHYWTLKSTKGRDRDQVVYRGTRANAEFLHKFKEKEDERSKWKKGLEKLKQAISGVKKDTDRPECWHWNGHTTKTDEHGCEQCANDIRKVSRIVMVDQLWMWILDEKTIITSFPRRYGTNKHDPSGVHKSIRTRLKNSRQNQIRSVYDLALIILDECSNEFFDRAVMQDNQPLVMDIFAEAIGNVTNRHTISFEKLRHWTKEASLVYRSHSKHVDTSRLHVPLLDINPEGRLQREIKDIVEELDIMIGISRKQWDMIRRFVKHVEDILKPAIDDIQAQRHRVQHGEIPWFKLDETNRQEQRNREATDKFDWFEIQAQELLSACEGRIDELEGLRKSAESTAQSVKDLLDLKQQQASVVQAWESVKQGEETMKQGRAIMIFTVITIIFLPLSFVSSLFGMNNVEFGGPDNPMTLAQQFRLMFPISFGIILLSTVLAYSSFLRALIWSASNFITTWLLIQLGLYRLWLSVSDEWSPLQLMRKTEERIRKMKDEVRQAKNVRTVRKREKQRDKASKKAEKDKEKEEKREQQGENQKGKGKKGRKRKSKREDSFPGQNGTRPNGAAALAPVANEHKRSVSDAGTSAHRSSNTPQPRLTPEELV